MLELSPAKTDSSIEMDGSRDRGDGLADDRMVQPGGDILRFHRVVDTSAGMGGQWGSRPMERHPGVRIHLDDSH